MVLIMKTKILVLLCSISVFGILGFATQTSKKLVAADSELKKILLEQLKKTHTQKDWFVPVNIAVEGLTAEQALWDDKHGNHSVGQLTFHLAFWNQRQLEQFKGIKSAAFSGNNEETFKGFDKAGWAQLTAKLDRILTDLETTVANANETQLKEWAPTIANISTHNAYHTGQIIYVRKLQGVWDGEKGVK
jgi:uncharacterized damage-inducible protein DinB